MENEGNNMKRRQIAILITSLILLVSSTTIAVTTIRHRIAERRKQSEDGLIVCAWRIDDEEETEDGSVCIYRAEPEELSEE